MKRLNQSEIETFAKILDFTLENATEIVEIFYQEKEKDSYRLQCTELDTVDDYIKEWEWNWYRYSNWEQLIESEKECGECGWTEDECKEEIDKSIFKLSSGMYVQNVF